jgi:dUTP pyrophosphatase
MELKFKKTEEWAKLPTKGTSDAAGIDLFISEGFAPMRLEPGHIVGIDTGIAVEIPNGHYGLIQSRSSSFKKGLWIHGVIDSDYRGSVLLQIRNVGYLDAALEPGKSYAQMIICPYQNIELVEANILSDTERGAGRLGSTGNN